MNIFDIKSAVGKGEITFYVSSNRMYCKDNTTEEVVCVSNFLDIGVKQEDKKYYIKLWHGGEVYYFQTICAGNQGKFDGQILTTPRKDEGWWTSSLDMARTQLDLIRRSLPKNPTYNSPFIDL